MSRHSSAQASDKPVYSRQDQKWDESHTDARSRNYSKDQSRGPWEGMTSSPHRSSVELVARASLPTNEWKDFKPQHLRTPPTSPRARAESDEFRRPPPHWEGEGDRAELDARERDRAKRSKREHTPRGRPQDQKPEPRSRSRSLSQAGVAKFRPTWNPRSQNNAIRREDLSILLHKTFEQYGPAREWPVEAEFFEHEGPKFKEQVQKQAWA
jgi:hypothetical protein